MHEPFSAIPWHTPTLWQEANASLDNCLRHNRHRLYQSFQQAQRLQERLMSIFDRLEHLCSATCPDCTDICCQRAWVWADFKDLLFLHLAGIPVPGRQLLSRRGESCRYGSPDGCLLARLQRPFVCTWYICPAQSRLLREGPAEKTRLSAALEQLKKDRHRMEDHFIQVVSR